MEGVRGVTMAGGGEMERQQAGWSQILHRDRGKALAVWCSEENTQDNALSSKRSMQCPTSRTSRDIRFAADCATAAAGCNCLC